MSVPSALPGAAGQDHDCELQVGCPYTHDVVGAFLRAETGWAVTDDKIKFCMPCEHLVAVSGTSIKNPGQLIAFAFALPIQSPFIPTSPAYFVPYVVVVGSCRRKGLGHRIVREVIRICKDERRLVEILPQQS